MDQLTNECLISKRYVGWERRTEIIGTLIWLIIFISAYFLKFWFRTLKKRNYVIYRNHMGFT